MAEELPPLIAQLIGDASDLFATLDVAEARLEAFAGNDYEAHLGLNTDRAITELAAFQLLADSEQVTVPVNVDVSGASGIGDLGKLFGPAGDIILDINDTDAVTKVEEVKAQILSIDDLVPTLDIDTAITEAKLASVDGTLAQIRSDAILADAAMAAMGSGDAGGGGGGGGGGAAAAGGGMAGWLANTLIVIHALHLFMPEILGLAAALVSAGAGFTVLGIAAAGTVSEISSGVTAVSTAQSAIQNAIPGTTQWSTAIGNLGQTWSQIPTDVQPAVSAIQQFINTVENSSVGNEVRNWAVGVVDQLTTMFSGAGSAFEPLILATERAVDTIIQIIGKATGSQGFKSIIDTLSNMVGPATIEIGQLVEAIAKIGLGFATAIQDGQGMEALVNFFRAIADVVNSTFFQGFIQGWVDFDRIITDILAAGAQLIGFMSQLGIGTHDVGVAIGFAVSAIAGLAALSAVSGWLSGVMGTAGGASRALIGLSGSMKAVLMNLIGPAALVIGVSGLSSEISKLTGIANPVGAAIHGIADALGLATRAAQPAADTISGYTGSLHGAIYGTQELSAANDLLVRSEQSIGSSLGGLANTFTQWSNAAVTASAVAASSVGQAATAAGTTASTLDASTGEVAQGFQNMVTKATDSVNGLIGYLQAKNGDLATWAADAQILIKRGMDPSAVASLAQTAPQDLASMTTATTLQLEQMNVQWQEQMLLATMSGQHGVSGFVTALENGIKTGTPTVQAAANALATQIGNALGIPFTGSQQSIDQIATALNNLPVSVVEALAGKTHQLAPAATDAATKTSQASAQINQSWGQAALGIAANVGMIAFGLKSTIGLVGPLIGKLFGLSGAEDAAAASATGMDVAMDANPIGLIALAVAALALGLTELVLHFDAVSKFLNGPWGTAISAAVAAVFTFIGIPMLIIGHWRGFVNFFKNDIPNAIHAFVGFFTAIPGEVAHVWGDVINPMHATWSTVASWVHGNVTGPIAAFFEAIPGTINHIWGDVVSAVHAAWSDTASWVHGNVTGPIAAFFTAIPGTINHVWSDVVSAIHSAWSSVASWVHGNVTGPVAAFFEAIPGATNHVWGDVVSALHSAWSDVANWVNSNIIQPIENFFKALTGDITSALSGVAAAIEAPFKAAAAVIGPILNGISSTINTLKNAAGGLGGAVGGAASTLTFGLLAEGGPAAAHMPYIIGESGPELFVPNVSGVVVPNGQLTSALSGTGSIGGGVISPVAAANSTQNMTITVQQPVQLVINNQVLAQTVQTTLLKVARSQGNLWGGYGGTNPSGTATSLNTNAVSR